MDLLNIIRFLTLYKNIFIPYIYFDEKEYSNRNPGFI
jgi:hypothetical protein